MVNKSFSAEEARAIEDLFMKNMNRPPRPPANRDPPELLEMNEKPLPDLLEIQHDKPLPGLRDLAFSNKKEILSTKRKISGKELANNLKT